MRANHMREKKKRLRGDLFVPHTMGAVPNRQRGETHEDVSFEEEKHKAGISAMDHW